MIKYCNFSKFFVPAALLLVVVLHGQTSIIAKNSGQFQTLSQVWELNPESKNGVFLLTKYKPIYILPFRYTGNPNEKYYNSAIELVPGEELNLNNMELKFQLSFKVKLAQDIIFGKSDLWMAYTQKSLWQVYNSDLSRPFRETNYEPELILNFPANFKVFGLDGKMFGMAFNHQSNGRTQSISRSWNRIIGYVAFEEKNWDLILRGWYGFQLDENPEILDYTGRADATFVYVLKKNIFTVHGQHSLRTGSNSHGQIQLDWGFPIKGNLRGHFQFFEGYGDTMIDYNYKQTIFGLGVSFAELL